jgi:hypothetical protein
MNIRFSDTTYFIPSKIKVEDLVFEREFKEEIFCRVGDSYISVEKSSLTEEELKILRNTNENHNKQNHS